MSKKRKPRVQDPNTPAVVYALTNKVDNRVYFGTSTDYKNRCCKGKYRKKSQAELIDDWSNGKVEKTIICNGKLKTCKETESELIAETMKNGAIMYTVKGNEMIILGKFTAYNKQSNSSGFNEGKNADTPEYHAEYNAEYMPEYYRKNKEKCDKRHAEYQAANRARCLSCQHCKEHKNKGARGFKCELNNKTMTKLVELNNCENFTESEEL